MRRIVAVVVTFRRPRALAVALDALAAQTRPLDGIIVVDNAGGADAATAEVLARAAARLGRALDVVRSPRNEGGAGGFARGLARAFENGARPPADAAWLLDDDCVPAADALERLLAPPLPPDALRAAAPLAEDDPHALAFPYAEGRFDPVRRRVVAERVLETPPAAPVRIVHPGFLGLLVPRAVHERIGPPLAALFFQADDAEYAYRAQCAGFEVHLVPASTVRHPPVRRAAVRVLGRDLRLPRLAPEKLYYFARNRVHVNRVHQGLAWAATRTAPVEMAAALARAAAGEGILPVLRALEGILDGLRGHLGERRRRSPRPLPLRPPAGDVRRVAAVIVTHDRPALLSRALAALAAQTMPCADVVVVDNGSAPPTGALIAREAPRARVVRHDRNEPPAAAFAAGLKAAFAAGADAAWLMDDDCEPLADALEALLRSGVARADRILIAMPVLAGDPRRLSNPMSAGRLGRRGAFVRRRGFLDRVPSRPEPFPVLSAPFNGALVGRAVHAAIGGPDPALVWQGEDKDYCLRAWSRGFEVLGVPGARVRHPRAPFALRRALGTRVLVYDLPPEKRFFSIRNNLVLAARHYPFPDALASVARILLERPPLRTLARAALAAAAFLVRRGGGPR